MAGNFSSAKLVSEVAVWERLELQSSALTDMIGKPLGAKNLLDKDSFYKYTYLFGLLIDHDLLDLFSFTPRIMILNSIM